MDNVELMVHIHFQVYSENIFFGEWSNSYLSGSSNFNFLLSESLD